MKKDTPIGGLPPVGSRIRIVGDHPWTGNVGMVVSHDSVGIVTKRLQAKVRLERDDAMNGHEFYVGTSDWRRATT